MEAKKEPFAIEPTGKGRYKRIVRGGTDKKAPFFKVIPFNAGPDLAQKAAEEIGEEVHAHDFYVVVIFFKNGGVHEIDFEKYPIEEGQMFFIAPNRLHRTIGTSGQEGIGIVFSLDYFSLNDFLFDSIRFSCFHRYGKQPFCKIPKERLQEFRKMGEELIEECSKPQDGCCQTEIQQLRLSLLFAYASRDCKWDVMTSPRPNDQYFRLMTDFSRLLENNLLEIGHQAQAYAKKLNVHIKQLTRACDKYNASTPKAMIDAEYFTLVKRALFEQKKPLYEIAADYDFSSVAHLSAFFRNEAGMTIREFLQQAGKDINDSDVEDIDI